MPDPLKWFPVLKWVRLAYALADILRTHGYRVNLVIDADLDTETGEMQ